MQYHSKDRFGIDFSAYDATTNSRLLEIVFDEIMNVFDVKHCTLIRSDFKAIKDCFIRTKILLPDGMVYQKDHGVCSGSSFTNLVDTLYNYGATKVAIHNMGCELLEEYSYFMGDDSSLVITKNGEVVSSRTILEEFSKEVLKAGLICNPEKIKIGPYFLSRQWTYPYGLGTRSLPEKVFLPERNRRYKHHSQIQNLLPSILATLGT